MRRALIDAAPAPLCFVRTSQVEPFTGVPDWRTENVGRDNGRLSEVDVLLVGASPRVEHIRDPDALAGVRALIQADRQLRAKQTPAPRGTHVSAVQLVVWHERGRWMVASVGRNAVDIQRWGRDRVALAQWPGEALGQLATLWLPLTDGAGGSNLRWRVALAATGPAPRTTLAGVPHGIGAGRPVTGTPLVGELILTELQLNVLVERFHEWLSFPAVTFAPKRKPVLDSRDGEQPLSRVGASRRRDTRLDRLSGLRDQLAARTGRVGPVDADFLRSIIEQGALRPADVVGYPEVDLSLLSDLGLLSRGPSRELEDADR
jgi:hypothetical protein